MMIILLGFFKFRPHHCKGLCNAFLRAITEQTCFAFIIIATHDWNLIDPFNLFLFLRARTTVLSLSGYGFTTASWFIKHGKNHLYLPFLKIFLSFLGNRKCSGLVWLFSFLELKSKRRVLRAELHILDVCWFSSLLNGSEAKSLLPYLLAPRLRAFCEITGIFQA